MTFSPDYFQRVSFKKIQIKSFFRNAEKDLELAEKSGENEIVLHFCYNAVIKLGIGLIAEKGFKVRSVPGHHIMILKMLSQLSGMKAEIKFIERVRRKRNVDMYEGGIALTKMEANEILRITKLIFAKIGRKNAGFTLVELIVAVGITGILMLGMATFFSSTFRNMFLSREQIAHSQGQFTVNTILEGKFVNAKRLQALGPAPGPTHPYAVIRNDMETGDLPFTYIGWKTTPAMGPPVGQIVFKDFFVFNGRHDMTSSFGFPIENPGGIEVLDDRFYVTAPLEDKIYSCSNVNNCPPDQVLDLPGLNQPIDLAGNSEYGDDTLYVTDAGNGQVLAIVNPGAPTQTVTPIATGLNYPTGIDYYNTGTEEYLFVADTYNHLVKKISLTPPIMIETVVGAGDDTVCNPSDGRDHTAYFCKLHFPTDVAVAPDNPPDNPSYYIADTGNDRVLKVEDPGVPANNDSFERISFVFKADYAVEKVAFTPFLSETFVGSSMTGSLYGSYNVVTHEFNVNSLFDAYDHPAAPCNWNLNGNKLYTDALDISAVEVGDLLSVGGNTYTVTNKTASRLVCTDPGPVIVDRAHMITLNGNLTGVSSGMHVYFGAKKDNEETIDFSFIDNSFPLKGFQTIFINVYEFGNATPITYKHFVRVGDKKLGTFEDTISVYSTDDYDFPTGIGWDGPAPQISGTPSYTTDFSDAGFDYISDFLVQDFGFTEANGGDVLQMNFSAEGGTDGDGNSLWRDYSLSSDVAP